MHKTLNRLLGLSPEPSPNRISGPGTWWQQPWQGHPPKNNTAKERQGLLFMFERTWFNAPQTARFILTGLFVFVLLLFLIADGGRPPLSKKMKVQENWTQMPRSYIISLENILDLSILWVSQWSFSTLLFLFPLKHLELLWKSGLI